jgi:hypothetical protein
MTPPRKRDLVKRAIRLYSCPEGPAWEEALAEVGLAMADLSYWRRRDEWPKLFAEVAEERLLEGLPIGISRLVEAAKGDRSASGVSAARALVDITRPSAAHPGEAKDEKENASDRASLDQLAPEEREALCKLLGRLRLAG